MADRVLFQMWSGYRAQLVEKHEFYVQQAKARLLDQFTDEAISEEADRTAHESWKARGRNFNPDYDDPADGAEDAYQDGVWRYQLLTDLRDSVRLNIVAGFFHEWEKNLRQWLVDEVRHWHTGDNVQGRLWQSNLVDLFDLLESFGWPLRCEPYFPKLDACRLIVNVHKHGDGKSLTNLSSDYPQYLEHPLEQARGSIGEMWFDPSHEHLKISDKDLNDFADAISKFWADLPENTFDSQISSPPSWLIKAIEKDNNNRNSK